MGESQRGNGSIAAGHVMLEELVPRAKLERSNAREKFVAANGEHLRDLGEKTIPIQDN